MKILPFRFLPVVIAFVVFIFGAGELAAADAGEQEQKILKHDPALPLVDFTDFKIENGVVADKVGYAAITCGNVQETAGPFGGKALLFNGLKKDGGTIDFTGVARKFDGYSLAISFWFRCDEYLDFRKNPALAGNEVCLGLSLGGPDWATFRLAGLSGGGFNNGFSILRNSWNHVVVIYAVDKKIKKLFVNGKPVVNVGGTGVHFPYRPMNGKASFGQFKGAVADLQMWCIDKPEQDFLYLNLRKENYNALQKNIKAIMDATGNAVGGKMLSGTMQEKLDELFANEKVEAKKYSQFQELLARVEKMIPAINSMKKTSLAAQPFAVGVIKPITQIIRTPLTYPDDADFTDELFAILAKDEYTSLSFIALPYRDIEKMEFEFTDLSGENGGIIPAAELDMHLVQCWYQSGWNTYFNGTGNYVPGLLLYDPALLKIDEEKRINYLKFHYPGGPVYHNITHWGSALKEPSFEFAWEPVWDADTLQPVPIGFGRNQQFWIDVHAPKDAKAGLYTGRIKVKVDGQPAGELTLKLKVLPYQLPLPRTYFDLNKPFTQMLAHGKSIESLKTAFKNEKVAREWFVKHMKNMRTHGFYMPPHAVPADESGEENFKFALDLYKELGFETMWLDGGAGFVSFHAEEVPFHEFVTEELYKTSMVNFKQNVDKIMARVDKYGLDRENVYFYGMDECQYISGFRQMSPFRNYVFRNGGSIVTTGWEDNYTQMPSFEAYHTTAALVDRNVARRWHAINGRITAYAAPFIGPDNPALMRHSHGLRMYRGNYDGWWNLAYDSDRYHTWNGLFGYDTTYRPFRFVVSTQKGPVINTVAICGFREGQNDVRYATLLRLLADECLKSDDIAAVQQGRRSISWLHRQQSNNDNLYEIRAGMIHHIGLLRKCLKKPEL